MFLLVSLCATPFGHGQKFLMKAKQTNKRTNKQKTAHKTNNKTKRTNNNTTNKTDPTQKQKTKPVYDVTVAVISRVGLMYDLMEEEEAGVEFVCLLVA